MKTFARRDGDDWVLNGSKRWIGLASIAQRRGRVGADRRRHPRLPRADRHPGLLRARASSRKLVDARVDPVRAALRRLPPPGDALLPAREGLRGPFSCAQRGALRDRVGRDGRRPRQLRGGAAARSTERTQFDRPIAGFQLTQQKLVDMVLELEKGALLALHLGRLKDAGPPAARADLRRQAQQRARGDRDRARGAHDPRRQRDHRRLPGDAPRGQPRVGADLRGHRRGAHADPRQRHHRRPRLPRRRQRLRTSSRTRSGDIGTARTPPWSPSASSTAPASAAPAPVTPPSPAPLAPSGLPGDGASSRISVPTRGVSAAVGSR